MSDYLRLRQICLVARELEPLAADLTAILGIRLCHRDENLARYGLANALFPMGTSFLEIVMPIRADTAAERFLDRSKGRGGYMAIFDCADPAARRRHADSLDVRTAHVIEHGDYFSVQLHPRDCRAAMIEFGHTRGGEALDGPYWPAGPNWQDYLDSEQACSLLGIDLESSEPDALAAHWGRILQLPVKREGQVPYIDVDRKRIRCHSADETRERLATLSVTVLDPQRALTRARERGYATDDAGFFVGGVRMLLTAA